MKGNRLHAKLTAFPTGIPVRVLEEFRCRLKN